VPFLIASTRGTLSFPTMERVSAPRSCSIKGPARTLCFSARSRSVLSRRHAAGISAKMLALLAAALSCHDSTFIVRLKLDLGMVTWS
jgi:hypothetical protein